MYQFLFRWVRTKSILNSLLTIRVIIIALYFWLLYCNLLSIYLFYGEIIIKHIWIDKQLIRILLFCIILSFVFFDTLNWWLFCIWSVSVDQKACLLSWILTYSVSTPSDPSTISCLACTFHFRFVWPLLLHLLNHKGEGCTICLTLVSCLNHFPKFCLLERIVWRLWNLHALYCCIHQLLHCLFVVSLYAL